MDCEKIVEELRDRIGDTVMAERFDNVRSGRPYLEIVIERGYFSMESKITDTTFSFHIRNLFAREIEWEGDIERLILAVEEQWLTVVNFEISLVSRDLDKSKSLVQEFQKKFDDLTK